MGQAKALLPLAGQTLVATVLWRLREIEVATAVVAIAAPHGSQIEPELAARTAELAPLQLRWVWNPRPEAGMLSSVQCALRPLVEDGDGELSGVLIWPVDIPRVRPETLRRLVEHGHAGERLLVPTYDGRGGHPLWLPRALWAETLGLPAAAGLRELRRRHPELRLPTSDPEILRDLDTPQDLQRLTSD